MRLFKVFEKRICANAFHYQILLPPKLQQQTYKSYISCGNFFFSLSRPHELFFQVRLNDDMSIVE